MPDIIIRYGEDVFTTDGTEIKKNLVIVRGAGDIGSGVIYRLVRCGFKVVALEIALPTAIRRNVSFAGVLFAKNIRIEGMEAVRAYDTRGAFAIAGEGKIPVLADGTADTIQILKPEIVIDAILAKKNMGTHIRMAPIVIGLGPGFTAGVDCHAAVETNRGHNLGRVLYEGCAEPDTGIPGIIGGHGAQRVIRAPACGIIKTLRSIKDSVTQGETIAHIGDIPVIAPLTGVLRGLIHDGVMVHTGLKIADVDPRNKPEYCDTISDKSRAIAGGVLEAVLALRHQNERQAGL